MSETSFSSVLSVKQAGCLWFSGDIWSSCWCVLSGVSSMWEGDSDTAVAAEWNQWWMTCQNGPCWLSRRLYWQAQLLHLKFSISWANRGSCRPQMWHVKIRSVIAHLSMSHSQITRLYFWMNLDVKHEYKKRNWIPTKGSVKHVSLIKNCLKVLITEKCCWCLIKDGDVMKQAATDL